MPQRRSRQKVPGHRALLGLTALAVLAVGSLPPSPVEAQGRTIVGEWAPNPRECTPIGGAITILPLGIVGDEMRCDFDTVVRQDNVVTWRGQCGFPEDVRRSTVVAATHGETLSVRINGQPADLYRRCRR